MQEIRRGLVKLVAGSGDNDAGRVNAIPLACSVGMKIKDATGGLVVIIYFSICHPNDMTTSLGVTFAEIVDDEQFVLGRQINDSLLTKEWGNI